AAGQGDGLKPAMASANIGTIRAKGRRKVTVFACQGDTSARKATLSAGFTPGPCQMCQQPVAMDPTPGGYPGPRSGRRNPNAVTGVSSQTPQRERAGRGVTV